MHLVTNPQVTKTYPSWNDANVQLSVQQSIQSIVQPQLDCLAERLVAIVASVQGDLRELEKFLDRWEVRSEGRFTAVESRLAVLSDGAVRTEQRERELNETVARLAGDLLHQAAASPAAPGESTTPRLTELECRSREATSRLERVEEATKKKLERLAKRCEERFEGLEASFQGGFEELQAQFDELWRYKDATGTHDRRLKGGVEERLAQLEEQVCNLSVAAETGAKTTQAAMLGQLDQQQAELQALSRYVDERCSEVQQHAEEVGRKQEDFWEKARSGFDQQNALPARLDDLNLRFGSLKVKSDNMEGRLNTMAERADNARRSGPEDSTISKDARYPKLEAVELRLEVCQRRLDELGEDCEEVVEQALERRLAVLAGAAPLSSRGGGRFTGLSGSHRSAAHSSSPRFSQQQPISSGSGTPSRPKGVGDFNGDEFG